MRKKVPDHTTHLGQLLIIGFDGTEMTAQLTSLLTRVQPAGVILFARNIVDAAQTWRLLRECQKCVDKALFACVDLEGGSVDRFRDLLGPTPAAAEVFATGDRKLFRKHGQIIADNCRALGFNVDFAPVLDLALEPSRSVLSSRAVSADPRQVTDYAREFLLGLRSRHVAGCGKHFPGLGEGNLDSHHDLPVIKKTLKTMWGEDLFPYRTLRAQLPMIMVSHAAYPLVTKTALPASLSKGWITEVLRKRIGYRGLIASDDLEMGAVLKSVSVGDAAVEHIRAGGNLCLVCHREDYVQKAYEELLKITTRDSRFARRAEESAQHVLAFKKKFAKWFRSGKTPSKSAAEKLSRRLWEFGEQVRVEAMAREDENHENPSNKNKESKNDDRRLRA
jgi:beta-N-acetylhexosaminidase